MKLPEKPVAKMKKYSADKYLPKLIVQAGAVTEVGKQWCIATYAAEGNDPLVFGTYQMFNDLDTFVSNPLTFGEGSHTRKRCQEAATLIQPEWKRLSEEVKLLKEDLDEIKEDLLVLEEALAVPPRARFIMLGSTQT